MIRELVQMFERELGTAAPTDMAYRLEKALCDKYGGERLYVPKLPKLVNQVKLSELGTGIGPGEAAKQLGISRITVWRARRKG